MPKIDKVTRILIMLYRLICGEDINKTIFSTENGITERSFDRDIEDIRLFLSELYTNKELIYDRNKNIYYLTNCNNFRISNIEIIAILKILLHSRSLREDEMNGLVKTVLSLVDTNDKYELKELMNNEFENYSEPNHNKSILKMQWDLNKCILKKRKINISYTKGTGEIVERVISPLSVVFSDYYFYLIAFIEGKKHEYPAFFRLDRIISFKILGEVYDYDLYTKYNIGEMIKSIKFMSGGKLVTAKLKIKSSVLDLVIDQLPNAKIVEKNNINTYIEARVFEEGFIKWVLSNANNVEVVEPIELRSKITNYILKILDVYSNENIECEENV